MKKISNTLLILTLSANLVFASGYWASPPKGLSHFVKRLPAKSLAELMEETNQNAVKKDEEVFLEESQMEWRIPRITKMAKEVSREEGIAKCDELLAEIRLSGKIHNGWVNMLHDIRDCLSDTETPANAAIFYCDWRIALGPVVGNLKKEQLTAINKQITTRNSRILAHFHYLLGASQFLSNNRRAQCGFTKFSQVIELYPNHPRAETALFMKGRAALDDSRKGWGDPPDPAKLTTATNAFQEYLKKYPEGRFVGDVYGWLGGIEVRRENYAKAMSWYVKQLDVPDHPEITRSASRMVERVMAVVLSKPDEGPIEDIASRPEIAMGTVYWILYAPEANIYNGFYDHPEVVEKWRKHWLPRLASAVEKNKKVWDDRGLTAWFAAIQAHAASNAGDQKKALAFVHNYSDELPNSDDLSFVHAVILQRSGDAEKAVSAYRNFLADFPNSPLREGASFRLATAYQDAGRGGDAVASLLQLSNKHELQHVDGAVYTPSYYESQLYPNSYSNLPRAASALSPSLTVAEEDQVNQYLDALLQFAPVPELSELQQMESALTPEAWKKIRIIILGRALSEGHPDIAMNFAGRDEAILAKEVASYSSAANKNPSAVTFLNLGNAWREARGRLTSPALQLDRQRIFEDDHSSAAEELRIENAIAIGFSEGAADRVLQMDELTNAIDAWERAAELAEPGSQTQATALAEILEALPLVAMATPFARKFAAENDWNARAIHFYSKLQTDCPGSPEAVAAARPFFRKPKVDNINGEQKPEVDPATSDPFDQESTGWTNYLYGFSQDYIRHREFLYESLLESPQNRKSDPRENNGGYQKLLDELYAIDAGGNAFELAFHMKHLRQRSRVIYTHWNNACIHYAIEDLAEMVSVKDPPPAEVRIRYFEVRRSAINVMAWHNRVKLQPVSPVIRSTGGPRVDAFVDQEIRAALAAPEMKPVADRLECLRLFILANTGFRLDTPARAEPHAPGESTVETRDWAEVEKGAENFLKQYPTSLKREAIHLLHMRAAYRARRPLLYSSAAPFPENPFIASDYIRRELPNQLPWDPKPVEDAIDAYLSDVKDPKYVGEVHDFRAAIAFRAKNWSECIDHSLKILDNPDFVDLHNDSLRRLSNVFAKLADRDDRVAIFEAVRKSPQATDFLKQYVEAADENSWGMNPLHFLSAWIRDRLDGKPVAVN